MIKSGNHITNTMTTTLHLLRLAHTTPVEFSTSWKIRAIFVQPWKIVSVSVRYLFYQPVDEKVKTWPLRFPAKENPNMEKALFDWPIVLQYDVKAKFLGIKVFSPERSLNQPKTARICISVRLLFLFCSRVFISRSYENRSPCEQTEVAEWT